MRIDYKTEEPIIEENKEDFIHFIARIEKENLEQHLKITNVK